MPENINTSSQKKSIQTHRRTTTRRKGVRLSATQRAVAQETFLEAFAANGNVRVACLKANIDRSTVHQWQEHDETFNMRYHLAKEDVNDAIRAEIYRRAMYGEERFVTSMGKVVYHEDKPLTIREKSDTLLIFHAKARMPEYRDKQQDVTVNVDVNGAKESLLSKFANHEEDAHEHKN